MPGVIGSHMIIGVPVLLIAIVFRLFPPRGINSFYGYRTPTSRQNDETWHFANRYSANGLILVGIATVMLQILDVRIEPRASAEMNATLVMVAGIVAVIGLTEWRLHRFFRHHL